MKADKIYFRASSVHKLMVGGSNFWSPDDESKLAELQLRSTGDFLTPSGKTGQYTPLMKSEHEILLKKHQEYKDRCEAGLPNFDLGKTAKTMVKKLWRQLMFGYREPMVVKETLKGQMTEQDCLELIEDVQPLPFFRSLASREDRRFNDWVSGLKDINYHGGNPGFLEDLKSAWTLTQFMEVETFDDINPDYYGQGNVYMELYNVPEFKIQYCLVNTPEELIKQEVRRFRYKMDVDEGHVDFKEVEEQLYHIHRPEKYIDPEQRVKTFAFEYDSEYMEELKCRVESARAYFETIRI